MLVDELPKFFRSEEVEEVFSKEDLKELQERVGRYVQMMLFSLCSDFNVACK